ncbi:hypothetical protein BAnh1_11090 [Bartonella australis AUST/NH1]|uniref:Uncharacterized protein n=1 Tax=Bartonella australis (strain Aust/NH1) TaxID=1094489 RepID=M1P026_BARAA|nr:hypothetical protein [Bartonella australis]AGF74977.1 hypothetical protein BAnh1_11090 [Bartonella australis AUST/NH1]
MKHIPFIKDDEILIVYCEDEDSGAYVGPIDQEEEVLDLVEGRDTVQRLLRLDLKTLHADDISEKIAHLYMEHYGEDEQIGQFQPFILESDAYHKQLDRKIMRDYEDNLYGSYEKQHRLRPCDVLSGCWW